MTFGRRLLVVLTLLVSIAGCSPRPDSVFDSEEVLERKEPVLILTPSAPCRGCILNTLKICRDHLGVDDYLIISPQRLGFLQAKEQFVEISEELYDQSLENDYNVYVQLNFENENTTTISMDNMEAYKELRTRIIQGKEEGVFD